ncbi:hypothetical protein [Microbulbifer guangxiensis]|uniref:hypothetical protein n=1 Tax=Microbulbifer guangxiensis TaxID=2904249 RepID=UPI001F281717|nr:hypothetical protein [Microbulbifer guangxiensis]
MKQHEFIEELKKDPVVLPVHVLEDLLGTICAKYGCCLSSKDYLSILENPPGDPDTLVRMIMELDYGGSEDEEIYNILFSYVYKTYAGAQRPKT